MTNEEQKDAFLQWMGKHLEEQRDKLKKFCSNKHLVYDDDIFSDTILKMSEKIQKNGIIEATEQGYDKYFFKSFKLNILREAQYSRNARRDNNITEVNELWEDYANANMMTAEDKLVNDLRKDFAAIYILSKVEHEFGSEMTRLYTEKYYLGITYKQLQKMHPEQKKLRDTLLEMKRWTIDNISKEEIDKAFNSEYSELID